MTYLPPGMLSFREALARHGRNRLPDLWQAAKPYERAVLEGDPIEGFLQRSALQPGALGARAYDDLRSHLVAGRLPAFMRVRAGAPRRIPAASWQAGGADRLPELLRSAVEFGLEADLVERGDVLIPEAALDALHQGGATEESARPAMADDRPSEQVRRAGGRPPLYDVATFLGIAARLFFKHDPSTAAKLRKLALEEYASTLPPNVTPSDEWAKRQMKHFWPQLRAD